MDQKTLLKQLRQALVVKVEQAPLPGGNLGVVVVDVVRGFTRQGALADPESMAPMVSSINGFVSDLVAKLGPKLHLLVLRDRHHPDIPEPPYPPHCILGTGEEELDPELQWLEDHPQATIEDKDCINGFVGVMRKATPEECAGQPEDQTLWRNLLVDWVHQHEIANLVVVGDCTDICVLDLTVALLSARNHGMLTRRPLEEREAYVQAITSMEILVYVPGCATYDLDPDGPMPEGMETLRHPGTVTQHVGLWIMESRGARLIGGLLDGNP